MKTVNNPHSANEESLISDTNPLGPIPSDASESQRPALIFNGCELWPYSSGVDLLRWQIAHSEDTGLTRALKLIFILWKRGGETAYTDFANYIIPLAWKQPGEIHFELWQWANANVKSDDDKVAALHLYYKILNVTPGAVSTAPPKKSRKRR